jgi:hypothetical protein
MENLETTIRNDVERYLQLRDYDWIHNPGEYTSHKEAEELHFEFLDYAKTNHISHEHQEMHKQRWLFNKIFDKYRKPEPKRTA